METCVLKFMSKNPQDDRGGGGSRAVYTMCKKTSDLVEDGFPNCRHKIEEKFSSKKVKRPPRGGGVCCLIRKL